VVTALRIGFGVPRRVGDPATQVAPPDHRRMRRYAQLAEQLLTAIGATTQRVQLGTLVLTAAFRHPALLARMAQHSGQVRANARANARIASNPGA